MNKKQKNRTRREKREAAEMRALEKRKNIEQSDEEDELVEELETPEPDDMQPSVEAEIIKEISDDPDYPIVGPTSFGELDDFKAAQEQEQAVRETAWNLQDIVRNILVSPDMEPDEKVAAIKEAADGFGERVQMEADEEEAEAEEKDFDLLELDALIAHDKRNTPLLENINDIISKAVLSTARRNKLPEKKFALPEKRKYPIHDKAHVRNALSRAAQQIRSGGTGATDARAALPKIRSAAKRMGIQVSTKKEHNALLIEKDAKGNWRWVGWVSNNFVDRDGDIISEAAHKDYVDWWEKNQDMTPAFLSWHTPGTARQAPVDYVAYENGFLIMSGPLQENEASTLLAIQKTVDLGMSHGTFVLGRDPADPRVITKYRMYECSDLPLEKAANPFTNCETIAKEAGMDKLAYLTQILGDEAKAKAFLEKTGVKQKELVEAGIENKEAKAEEVAAQTPPPPVQEPVKEDELVARVMKELDIENLNAFVEMAREAIEKVPVLEQLIKELGTTQDQKLAEALTPPVARFAWSKDLRASQSKETEVKPDEKLSKATPGVSDDYWLSKLTNTAPIKSD